MELPIVNHQSVILLLKTKGCKTSFFFRVIPHYRKSPSVGIPESFKLRISPINLKLNKVLNRKTIYFRLYLSFVEVIKILAIINYYFHRDSL
jgi:hypothetical protein